MKHSVLSTRVLLFVLTVFLLSGIAAADVEENLTYQGDKARITVGKIKSKATK